MLTLLSLMAATLAKLSRNTVSGAFSSLGRLMWQICWVWSQRARWRWKTRVLTGRYLDLMSKMRNTWLGLLTKMHMLWVGRNVPLNPYSSLTKIGKLIKPILFCLFPKGGCWVHWPTKEIIPEKEARRSNCIPNHHLDFQKTRRINRKTA